jgi:hypothetical protein
MTESQHRGIGIGHLVSVSLALLVGKGLASLPQFEPVRSAFGLSTPPPCGNPVFRNAFLMRLRRGDCARHLSSTDSENVCRCDPSAPLHPSLPAFGLPLRAGRRRRIADEAPPRLPHPRPAPKAVVTPFASCPFLPPGAPAACYKLSAAASASNSLKISGC